jgi:hypothetical protein
MRRLVLTLAVGASLAFVPAVRAADAPNATTCGFIHASVPYSSHGHAKKWRVYVTGKASCATATKVLNAVMHLQGVEHSQGGEAGSYLTYASWMCPFGQMGEQTCELPTRLPAHPPIRAHALALSCAGAEERCPRDVPASEV